MKPGRRAFLLPGFMSSSPWASFMQRLARVVQGGLHDHTADPSGPGRASLRVARDEDVHHARALCLHYGVVLHLPGAVVAQLPAERHWLSLDVTALDAIDATALEAGRVVVEPGCTWGALRSRLAGSTWSWPDGSETQTVAEWLAGPHGAAPGHSAQSGLGWAEVMLASGEVERLAAFGADATRPLQSAASGRLVAGLFEAAASLDMPALQALPVWPGAYRLDAMQPQAEPGAVAVPNLSHILLGSAGTLAWVGRVQLVLRPAGATPLAQARPLPGPPGRAAPWTVEMADDKVKQLFDPEGLFPRPVV